MKHAGMRILDALYFLLPVDINYYLMFPNVFNNTLSPDPIDLLTIYCNRIFLTLSYLQILVTQPIGMVAYAGILNGLYVATSNGKYPEKVLVIFLQLV